MRGHLRERSPGHWAIVIDVRDPATGKRKRKWHSFKGTKREAQSALAAFVTEAERGRQTASFKMRLADYATQWLASRHAAGELDGIEQRTPA